jgi:hypothetical protein
VTLAGDAMPLRAAAGWRTLIRVLRYLRRVRPLARRVEVNVLAAEPH